MNNINHGFVSPLRYPGGKGIIANYIKMVLKFNKFLDGEYAELYAGGSGVALALLFEEYVRHIHINDISKPIYAFWKSIFDHTDELSKMIYDTKVTMSEWSRQKDIQKNSNAVTGLELGFSTFFLNRTNRSGIINGGVIGGKHQMGKWKLDARYQKKDLVSRIEKIAKYKNRITIYNLDAGKFITNELPRLSDDTFIYLDPPYFVKGKDLYEDHYSKEDHATIAQLIQTKIRQPWLVTYDAAPEILDIYQGYKKIQYGLNYSAQDRYTGSEVMFFSESIKVPDTPNPTKVSADILNQIIN